MAVLHVYQAALYAEYILTAELKYQLVLFSPLRP